VIEVEGTEGEGGDGAGNLMLLSERSISINASSLNSAEGGTSATPLDWEEGDGEEVEVEEEVEEEEVGGDGGSLSSYLGTVFSSMARISSSSSAKGLSSAVTKKELLITNG